MFQDKWNAFLLPVVSSVSAAFLLHHDLRIYHKSARRLSLDRKGRERSGRGRQIDRRGENSQAEGERQRNEEGGSGKESKREGREGAHQTHTQIPFSGVHH